MHYLSVVFQIVIAAGIVNVWILRHDKATAWRPDGAKNMKEEFRRYGLPDWMRVVVGTAKLSLAAMLVAGIWYPPLAAAAGIGMAILMLGAVASHIKISDPIKKAVPSLALLALSLFVGYANGAF